MDVIYTRAIFIATMLGRCWETVRPELYRGIILSWLSTTRILLAMEASLFKRLGNSMEVKSRSVVYLRYQG